MAKRIIDILISGTLLFFTAPLMLLIALLIKLDSKGYVFFTPTRIGLNGRPFVLYKFRTMSAGDKKEWLKRFDPAKMDDFVFQAKQDPRITRVGRLLRKTSLDELPNLVNVLVGQMSIVGPRPEEPEIVEHYTEEQRRRLSMRPGITGLAQVSGRGELSVGDMIGKDLEYIDNYSLWLDVKILAKTPWLILTARGAR